MAMQELIEAPLSAYELAVRYRALCADPCYANIPGKIELDAWGRMVMSPASNYHSALQALLVGKLAVLRGRAFVEVSVVTTPYTRAPELCIEVVSPSNSREELREKVATYVEAGTVEVWIVFPQSRRIEFHGPEGLLPRSQYAIDLADIFG